MRFDSVEELYTVSSKVNALIANQKYNDINEAAENNRFRTVAIEHQPLTFDIEIPSATINAKEEYSTAITLNKTQYLLKVCPISNFDNVFNIYLEN